MDKIHIQTVQIQIRLLLQEQSDQGLHRLPFHQELRKTNALKGDGLNEP